MGVPPFRITPLKRYEPAFLFSEWRVSMDKKLPSFIVRPSESLSPKGSRKNFGCAVR